jgi:hypothetical protein
LEGLPPAGSGAEDHDGGVDFFDDHGAVELRL